MARMSDDRFADFDLKFFKRIVADSLDDLPYEFSAHIEIVRDLFRNLYGSFRHGLFASIKFMCIGKCVPKGLPKNDLPKIQPGGQMYARGEA